MLNLTLPTAAAMFPSFPDPLHLLVWLVAGMSVAVALSLLANLTMRYRIARYGHRRNAGPGLHAIAKRFATDTHVTERGLTCRRTLKR